MERVTGEDGKRYYTTPQGNKYQSVTTLTGKLNAKEIQAWRNRVGEQEATKISTRAANRGTRMHKFCEDYLHNKIKTDPLGRMLLEENNLLNVSMFNKIKPLVEQIDNIRLIEGTMYSDSLELAGTADCIADHNGALSVIDFKTSTNPKKKEYIKNYFMQGAAYGKMFEELYKEAPNKIVIMIASENATEPDIFEEPYDKCLSILQDFILTLR